MLKPILIVLFGSLFTLSFPSYARDYACTNTAAIKGDPLDEMGGQASNVIFKQNGHHVNIAFQWSGDLLLCDSNALTMYVSQYIDKHPAADEQAVNMDALSFLSENFPSDSTASIRIYLN